MYEIFDIVWGIPYTEEIEEAFAKMEGCTVEELDPYNLEEEYGFELLYSGHADFTPGFMGESLDAGAYWEMNVQKIKTLQPTNEQRDKVQKMFDALPEEIKVVASPIDFYTIWSTS
jgi:hypothetical protein